MHKLGLNLQAIYHHTVLTMGGLLIWGVESQGIIETNHV